MKSKSEPIPATALLVNAIIEEEALLSDLVRASRQGQAERVLEISARISALRSSQEAASSRMAAE